MTYWRACEFGNHQGSKLARYILTDKHLKVEIHLCEDCLQDFIVEKAET